MKYNYLQVSANMAAINGLIVKIKNKIKMFTAAAEA
jgi:hypothetical protein